MMEEQKKVICIMQQEIQKLAKKKNKGQGGYKEKIQMRKNRNSSMVTKYFAYIYLFMNFYFGL